jgi:hypothetical protein
MNKSIRTPLWLRLIPIIFLIAIPIIDYLFAFVLFPATRSEEWAIDLAFLIVFLSLPVLILTIITFVSPLKGGILSLILIPLIIVLRDSLSFDDIQFTWVICGCLFLAGISGLFIGIWDSRGKRNRVKNHQYIPRA